MQSRCTISIFLHSGLVKPDNSGFQQESLLSDNEISWEYFEVFARTSLERLLHQGNIWNYQSKYFKKFFILRQLKIMLKPDLSGKTEAGIFRCEFSKCWYCLNICCLAFILCFLDNNYLNESRSQSLLKCNTLQM